MEIIKSLLNKSYYNYYESDKIFQLLIENGIFVKKEKDENIATSAFYNMKLSSNRELRLTIMPTEQCNLRCIYCYETFENGEMQKENAENVICYIKKNIWKYNSLYINWFGGEPLLALEIIVYLSNEIIQICKKNKVKFEAGITTNAILLTRSVFLKLIDCNVIDYQITIDGDCGSHDFQRIGKNGEFSFKLIIKNLIEISSNSNKFFIVLRSNIGEYTKTTMIAYIDKIYDLFGLDKRFYLHFIPILDLKGNIKSNDEVGELKEIFKYYKYAISKGFNFKFYKYLFQPGRLACYASDPNSYVIGSDCKIYKCTVAFNQDINRVGQLTDNGEMILFQEKLDYWMGSGRESDQMCYNCNFSPVCMGKSCPKERIINNVNSCPSLKSCLNEFIELFSEDISIS